jgi:hypothetical protein
MTTMMRRCLRSELLLLVQLTLKASGNLVQMFHIRNFAKIFSYGDDYYVPKTNTGFLNPTQDDAWFADLICTHIHSHVSQL